MENTNQVVTALVAELNRQQNNKYDIVLDSRTAVAVPEPGRITLNIPIGNTLTGMPLTDWAKTQLAQKFEIPERYYRKMEEEKEFELLATNINKWTIKTPKKIMVRTLDRNIRGIMSDRFKVIENRDVLMIALDAFTKNQATVLRADISDRNLFIKVVTHKMQGEIKVGDIIQGGLMIRNSEVGASRLAIQPFLNRLACTNGMIISENIRGTGFSTIHLGQRKKEGMYQFSEQTMNLETATIFSKIRDVINQTLSPGWFESTMNAIKTAAQNKVPLAETAISNIVQMNGLSDTTRDNILKAYLGEPDPSQWGIINAVTSAAKMVTVPEDRIKMEEIGGSLALMTPNIFTKMTEAEAKVTKNAIIVTGRKN